MYRKGGLVKTVKKRRLGWPDFMYPSLHGNTAAVAGSAAAAVAGAAIAAKVFDREIKRSPYDIAQAQ